MFSKSNLTSLLKSLLLKDHFDFHQKKQNMKYLKLIVLAICIFIVTPSHSQTSPQNNACPCCTETHRQFDFWLGDWETTANGKLAGTNHIVLLQDSCIIQENWTSANGKYSGTSYNFFNKDIKKWQQIWIDNQGANLILTGERIDNQMIMKSGELVSQKGEKYINKITWTNNADGTVRQNWEVSKDDGKTWTSIFDGLYKKKN